MVTVERQPTFAPRKPDKNPQSSEIRHLNVQLHHRGSVSFRMKLPRLESKLGFGLAAFSARWKGNTR